jgi:hypothetical protein
VTFSPNDASICPRPKDMYMIRTAPLATPPPSTKSGVYPIDEKLCLILISRIPSGL